MIAKQSAARADTGATSGTPTGKRLRGALLAAALLSASAAGAAANEAATAFQHEVHAAMDRMMRGMDAAPTGDIDQDFVAMMEPHHQGAIDMAVSELRYGKNPQLQRIAQEIIIEQQQEIAAMRIAIGKPLPASAPAPTTIPPDERAPHSMHHGAPSQ